MSSVPAFDVGDVVQRRVDGVNVPARYEFHYCLFTSRALTAGSGGVGGYPHGAQSIHDFVGEEGHPWRATRLHLMVGAWKVGKVVDINLNGSYWAAQACGRVMQPGSSVINISSVLGITTAGLPQAAYSASKAAIAGLTRDLAQQWGTRKGIRVNAIAPGFFASEMTDQYKPGYLESVIERSVLGRTGDPAELAATLVWLASPAGGYVTGQTIVVDGGWSSTKYLSDFALTSEWVPRESAR